MALSILWCGNLRYGLWDSKTEKFLLTGTMAEMEEFKDRMEKAEQVQLNREHFKELRSKYLDQLMKGGSSEEKATIFLKEKMPYLWD